MPGPVPKRTTERRRVNNEAGQLDIDQPKLEGVVEVPAGDDTWNPIALRWYESLEGSGQSVFYEPSDWATAWLLADQISRHLEPQFIGFRQIAHNETEAEYANVPMNGSTLASLLKGMSLLMVTEADRRRMRIEVERGAAAAELPDGVSDISTRRQAHFQ